MEYWQRIYLWGSWAAFALVTAAYVRLWYSAGVRNLHRMEHALAEGVKQLDEKGEYIEDLEQAHAEQKRLMQDLQITNARLHARAIDLENDRKKLMKALEVARMANELLVKNMGEAARMLKKNEEKMEALERRVIQLETQLGHR